MIDGFKTRSTRSFDGAELVYDIAPGAAGTPVVLIHGWTCRRSDWAGQALVLAELPIVALDLAGHGDSSAGSEPRSPETFARDVEAVMDAAGLDEAVLVGHSMGGAVALEMARRAPQRVRGIVLVDTFVIDYGGLDETAQAAIHDPFANDFGTAMGALVDNTAGGADEVLKASLKARMGSADPAVALPAWRALLAWDPAPALAAVRAPVHAINGGLIPESARQRWSERITETVIPDTGHFLHMEAPEHFNPALAAALAGMRGTNP